ncbi:MAG: gluconate 2-dehydrogenase subunit 3 family protein [Gemmatimonadales bacterium]|nr:gluconate 2-dehydrogenase subunit 3 family protein [Gemmatimonadales bacterium]
MLAASRELDAALPPVPGAAPRRREPLAAEARADLAALAEVLIPSDDLPGAREAQVITYLERALDGHLARLRPLFDGGLADLAARARAAGGEGARFATLPAAQQVAIVQALESEKSAFFEAARHATISGFLGDPSWGGNANKVGWQVIGFEDRYAWTAPFGWYDDASAP